MSGKWPRRITTTFVLLSISLQIAAIFSPGWLIDIRANYEEYESLFYKLKCETLGDDICEVETLWNIYRKAVEKKENAGMPRVAIAELDYAYNLQVLKQTLVIISLFVTLVLMVAQTFRHCNVNRRYHRLITRSAVFGTIPTGLMIGVICMELVRIDFMMELRSFDGHEDNTYIGFPYSLAMYIGGLVFLEAGILVLMYQSAGPGKARPKPKKLADDEESVDDGPPVKAEFIPIHEDSSPTSVENSTKEKPISTISYSEKL